MDPTLLQILLCLTNAGMACLIQDKAQFTLATEGAIHVNAVTIAADVWELLALIDVLKDVREDHGGIALPLLAKINVTHYQVERDWSTRKCV